jgi:ankyrin repeat protein
MKFQAISTFLGVALLLLSALAQAQENKLLERSFWKSKPSLEEVQTLVAAGNKPAALNSNAFDPLVYALLEDAPEPILHYLLQAPGNNIEKRTHDGRTYLFWSAYANNLSFTKHLLDQGAKTDVLDDHGYTVLNFVASTGGQNPDLYNLLIHYDKALLRQKTRTGANALLLLLPHLSSPRMIEYLTQQGLDLNGTDLLGNNAFYYAAKGGQLDMLNWLLQSGVRADNINATGENAIMAAAMGMRRHSNNLEVFEYLADKQLDPACVSTTGNTPLLTYAANGEHTKVFDFLLAAGNRVDHTDDLGNTALMAAAKSNSPEVVQLLLNQSKNINARNKEGLSALSLAVAYNKASVVKALIEAGADVQVADEQGNTLLYYVLLAYSAETTDAFNEKLNLLEQQGLSLNSVQAEENNLFHLAAKANALALLERAHASGVPVNARNLAGLTPLHLAAMRATNTETLRYLVSIGADVTATTDFGETPYALALENEMLTKQKVPLTFLKP